MVTKEICKQIEHRRISGKLFDIAVSGNELGLLLSQTDEERLQFQATQVNVLSLTRGREGKIRALYEVGGSLYRLEFKRTPYGQGPRRKK